MPSLRLPVTRLRNKVHRGLSDLQLLAYFGVLLVIAVICMIKELVALW